MFDSFIYEWNNKIDNIKSGMIFLGANPLLKGKRGQILSTTSNHIIDISLNKINVFTNDLEGNIVIDNQLLNNYVNSLNEAISIIEQYKNILEYGANEYGFMPSSISKKLLINQIINVFYLVQLENFSKSSEQNISISNLVNTKLDNDLFSFIFSQIESKSDLNNEDKQLIKNSLENFRKTLGDFVLWYSTEYYAHISSYGTKISEDINNYLSLSKSNYNDERQNTIVLKSGIKIYGLGLTNNELNCPNIGIGFMNIKNTNDSIFVKNGNELYEQLLKNTNSFPIDPETTYNEGIKRVENLKVQMIILANRAKEYIDGSLNDPIFYDDDGIGINIPKLTDLNGRDIFQRFNMWLNQEDFYTGRQNYSDKNKEIYVNWFLNSKLCGWVYWGHALELKNKGYCYKWANSKSINNLFQGSANGLMSFVSSLEYYRLYRLIPKSSYIERSLDLPTYYYSNFSYMNDYQSEWLNNFNFDFDSFKNSPNSPNIFLNPNPYYRDPIWTINTQDSRYDTIGLTFLLNIWEKSQPLIENANLYNEALINGWTSFAQWYANEVGFYGKNLDSISRMPNDFLKGNSIINERYVDDYINYSDQKSVFYDLIFSGAFPFYNKTIGDYYSSERTKNTLILSNMLQYYGYLNNQQLDNISLVADFAINYNGNNTSNTNNDVSPFGSSINQVRKYIENNSASSIDNTRISSLKYLLSPSIATSNYIGFSELKKIYLNVEKKTGMKLNDFNNKTTIKELFVNILKNGPIPIKILADLINKEYNIEN